MLYYRLMPRHSFLQQMSNLLWEELPDYVTVGGEKYPVHTSFKNWVGISVLAEEKGLKDAHALAQMLKLCYSEKLPPDIVSAVCGMLAFLNGDTEFSVSSDKKTCGRVFSFSQDASVIYSGFYSRYGIDLEASDMHWYKFCALFENLADDNPFKTLIRIRTFDESCAKSGKAARHIRELKAKYGLKNEKEVNVADGLSCLF